MLNIINKMYSVPNVPHTKIAEELGIPVRNVTDRVVEQLGESSEKVLRLLQIAQIQHTYVKRNFSVSPISCKISQILWGVQKCFSRV